MNVKKDFLKQILLSDDVVNVIREHTNQLCELMPEIKSMIGFEHRHPHHHLDVWEHTLLALKNSEKNFDVRLCLLLHDSGKPFVCTEKDGIRHFYNHGEYSAKLTKKYLTELEFDEKYIDKICFIIKNHDNPISEDLIKNDLNLAKIIYEVQRCDTLAHNPEKLEKRLNYLKEIEKLIKNEENKK